MFKGGKHQQLNMAIKSRGVYPEPITAEMCGKAVRVWPTASKAYLGQFRDSEKHRNAAVLAGWGPQKEACAASLRFVRKSSYLSIYLYLLYKYILMNRSTLMTLMRLIIHI